MPGGDVVHVAGDAHLRRQRGCGEQALDVGADGGVGVGYGGGFEGRLGEAGRLGGPVPEAGVGEEARSALRVMDDRDFEERVRPVEQLLSQVGEVAEVGDVVDDGLGDASSGVADDGSVSEPEPEDDRGVNPVVEAADDDHLAGGQAECYRGVGAGELLVALEQGGILVMLIGSLPRNKWTLSTITELVDAVHFVILSA